MGGSKNILCDYGRVMLGLHLRWLRELGEIAGGGGLEDMGTSVETFNTSF